jgi:iron(III) transport system substrate-binding protein
MNAPQISRRNFSKGLLCAPVLAATLARAATLNETESAKDPYWWQKEPPKPKFKPVGVDRSKVLKIYSGRTKPDLSPVYMIWEELTGMRIDLTVMSHFDVMARIVAERSDPQADLMVTNTNVEPEIARASGVFDPYKAPVAQEYPDWLRAPDYSWMSFTAWPRTAMINWAVLGRDQAKWPKKLEDLAEPEFRGKVVIASIQESIVTTYFAALRAAKGDEWTGKMIDRILDNGARIYHSHVETRNALIREGYGVALVNSSNNSTFLMQGHAVGEAWLDQDPDGIGTYIDSHTTAVLRGGHQPEAARHFIDFLLSKEIQELLARLYGEVPVNPVAMPGWVRPIAGVRRIAASGEQVAARFKDTQAFMRAKGFDMIEVSDPLISFGRAGQRRDKEVPGALM